MTSFISPCPPASICSILGHPASPFLGQHPGAGSQGAHLPHLTCPRFNVVGWASGVTVSRTPHLSILRKDLPASPSIPAPTCPSPRLTARVISLIPIRVYLSHSSASLPLTREPRDEPCGHSPTGFTLLLTLCCSFQRPSPSVLLLPTLPRCCPHSQQLLHAAW